MDKNEILEIALRTKGKKESLVILCINMIESLYEDINLEDMEKIRSLLASYHRKYNKLEDLHRD